MRKRGENKGLGEESLKYHESPPAGKVGINCTKPLRGKKDLSLAYTPGVGEVCKEISGDKGKVWNYTNRGNSVAVISDGTAVLGLGDIGPEAGLPVMEGKSVLFKKFANIDAYPICISPKNGRNKKDERKKEIISAVSCLEPTFAGINLEDIAAPECFELQKELDKKMGIPVFHDDQDGTAVIIVAGLMNALELTGRKPEEIKIVISGAGSAGIACARLLTDFGLNKKQIYLCDSKGLITLNRKDINEYKKEFAQQATSDTGSSAREKSSTDTKSSAHLKPLAEAKSSAREKSSAKQPALSESTSSAREKSSAKTSSASEPITLEEVIKNADVFIGVSAPGILTEEMVKTMKKDPIIFAAANPVPEIMPDIAKKAGAKIVATGRSDFPNQVNNVLGFPGIFRGALDVRAKTINKEMKIEAARALAELAKEKIDKETYEILAKAYPEEARAGIFNGENPVSENYIIPKPFDPRVVPKVAQAVSNAAIKSGVASAATIKVASKSRT